MNPRPAEPSPAEPRQARARPDVTAAVAEASARGQQALAANDPAEARRWLERAHRLVPDDPSQALVLAGFCLAHPQAPGAVPAPALALRLFTELAATHDVREVWAGLAAARRAAGDWPGAAQAVARALGGHALFPPLRAMAPVLAQATGAPGWCALEEGELVIQSAAPVVFALDAGPPAAALPLHWRQAAWLSVTADGRHLLGSPLALADIRATQGTVRRQGAGLSGWAWHPRDPDRPAALRLTDATGRVAWQGRAEGEGPATNGLLARPRRFAIPAAALQGAPPPWRITGDDGAELAGSPLPNPAAPSRTPRNASRAQEAAAFRATLNGRPSALLVTHGDGGGVERFVAGRAAALRAQGLRPIILRPAPRPLAAGWCVVDGQAALRFRLPAELPALAALLRPAAPAHLELHHLLGHDHAVLGLAEALGIPHDVYAHDHALVCPRITLIGPGGRYCGEPDEAACAACLASKGSNLEEDISVPALRARSAADLSAARAVYAPSADMARRLRRHLPGVRAQVTPWQADPTGPATPRPAPGPRHRIILAGAMGEEKGFSVLRDCAADAAARDLPLDFILVGHSIDDAALMATGRVFVTGSYREEEAVALLRAQGGAVGFLPSIWPESWCYALTHLWDAGLDALAFDIGTPAERIRRTGRGRLIPLGAPAGTVNAVLCDLGRRATASTTPAQQRPAAAGATGLIS